MKATLNIRFSMYLQSNLVIGFGRTPRRSFLPNSLTLSISLTLTEGPFRFSESNNSNFLTLLLQIHLNQANISTFFNNHPFNPIKTKIIKICKIVLIIASNQLLNKIIIITNFLLNLFISIAPMNNKTNTINNDII